MRLHSIAYLSQHFLLYLFSCKIQTGNINKYDRQCKKSSHFLFILWFVTKKLITLSYTKLFKNAKQVIPTYINHSRPLIPDEIHLIFERREKPDLSLYAEH